MSRRAGGWCQGVWRSHASAISCLLLGATAVVAISSALSSPVRWTTDSLFYEAQMYELRGESQSVALRRVFSSPKVVPLERTALKGLVSPRWISFSAPLYRRRWVTPAIAAALYPLAGERSLVDASALGYVAVALLLFALLRRRFTAGPSLIATTICLLLPPLRTYAGFPLTDSWGLALECAALLGALVALERGGWWLAAWGASMVLLSLAKDATLVLVVGTVAFWLLDRTRRSAAVAIVGVLAAIPVPLIFGAPLAKEMSWNIVHYRIPQHTDWGFVLSHLPHVVAARLRDDLLYPSSLSLPVVAYVVAAALVAAVLYMAIAAPRRDPFFVLTRAILPAGLVLVVMAVAYTGFRVELVFIPAIAAGVAFTLEQRDVLARRLPIRISGAQSASRQAL